MQTPAGRRKTESVTSARVLETRYMLEEKEHKNKKNKKKRRERNRKENK